MQWTDVRNNIDSEVKRIWSDESDDITRLRMGVCHGQAGSFGQYFSTMVFALTYTLALGEHVVYGLVKGADNDKIPLEALKELTREHFVVGFRAPMFVGYVLAPKAESFAEDIVAVLDGVKSREDFKALLGAYFTYQNILHWWLHVYFPWSLGAVFEQVDADRVKTLQRLVA
jgi:hypothetical protein